MSNENSFRKFFTRQRGRTACVAYTYRRASTAGCWGGECTWKCSMNGGKLLACGNGGSAADASHLTTEYVCRFSKDRRPYPAISLATHGGDITAIGNDYCFEDLFARQVEALAARATC